MHCTNCAAEVPKQRKFCGRCGAAVVRRCRGLRRGKSSPEQILRRLREQIARGFSRGGADGTGLAPDRASAAYGTVLRPGRIDCAFRELDPEDFGAIIAGYRRCITETVACFDGFVARHHGDGAVVYFGYPHAHEDDAERAVQASLALVQAVAALPTKEKLSARVGVATGVALVGDMSDSAISEEHGILGDTPNFAARLQSLAQPGGVIISGRTKTNAGPQFEYLDLGKVEIKGFAKPVAAWQVAGKTAVTSRSHALQSSDLLPLIGRDEEMALLLRRWERARSGEGQVVLLSGEAGIGKSRLTVALLEQLAREPHIRLRCFCSPQHTDSTLYPVIGEMLRAARFALDDSQQVKMDKLDALLAQSSTPPQDAALFAEMLSLPNDGRYPPVEVEPQLRRQKTLKALGSQIEALARINPVLLIFEDAHWADPTSLELFARAVDLAVSHRLLILVTFRPEFSPRLIRRPHVSELTLHRLAPCDINFLIERSRRQPIVAGGYPPGHHRAHRRHSVVRRRDDQGGAGRGG